MELIFVYVFFLVNVGCSSWAFLYRVFLILFVGTVFQSSDDESEREVVWQKDKFLAPRVLLKGLVAWFWPNDDKRQSRGTFFLIVSGFNTFELC